MPNRSQFKMEILLQAVDRMSKPVQKISRSLERLGQSANMSRLNASLARSRDQLQRASGAASEFGSRLRGLGRGALIGVTAPIGLVGGFALKSAASMEKLEVSFRSMLGSGKAASKMVQDLTTFAARTPFQMEGIGAAAKQLLAFGVHQDVDPKECRLRKYLFEKQEI